MLTGAFRTAALLALCTASACIWTGDIEIEDWRLTVVWTQCGITGALLEEV